MAQRQQFQLKLRLSSKTVTVVSNEERDKLVTRIQRRSEESC